MLNHDDLDRFQENLENSVQEDDLQPDELVDIDLTVNEAQLLINAARDRLNGETNADQ